eukprot:scaffold17879_cov95-Isochrysis_galbana.AAC.3
MARRGRRPLDVRKKSSHVKSLSHVKYNKDESTTGSGARQHNAFAFRGPPLHPPCLTTSLSSMMVLRPQRQCSTPRCHGISSVRVCAGSPTTLPCCRDVGQSAGTRRALSPVASL